MGVNRLSRALPLVIACLAFACKPNQEADLPSWGTGPAPVPPAQVAPSTRAQTYAAVGSNWRFTLTPTAGSSTVGTFTAVESTTSTAFSGTFARPTDPSNSSGFIVLINKPNPATDTGQAPTMVTTIPGIELPGTELMLAPIIHNETSVINGIAVRGCPTVGFATNYISTRQPSMSPVLSAGNAAFGMFTYDPSTSAYQIIANYKSDQKGGFADLPTAPKAKHGACVDGVWTAPGLPAELFLNATGGGLLHYTGAGQTNFGFPTPTAHTVDLTSLAGNYVGFVYTATTVKKVMMVVPSTPGMAYTSLLDDKDLITSVWDPGAQPGKVGVPESDGKTTTLDLSNVKFDSPSPGFFMVGTGPDELACTGAVGVNNSDLKLITCMGAAVGSTDSTPQTQVFVSHHAPIPTCGSYNCPTGCCLPDGTCQGSGANGSPPVRTAGQPFYCGNQGSACQKCAAPWGGATMCVSGADAGPNHLKEEACGT